MKITSVFVLCRTPCHGPACNIPASANISKCPVKIAECTNKKIAGSNELGQLPRIAPHHLTDPDGH